MVGMPCGQGSSSPHRTLGSWWVREAVFPDWGAPGLHWSPRAAKSGTPVHPRILVAPLQREDPWDSRGPMSWGDREPKC